MEAFTQFEGTTLPLMNDNIDTDQNPTEKII